MLLQPFIENSIEHGISQLADGALISIRFQELEKELKICIEDNGKGLTAEKSDEKTHVSRATQITTERLKILNQKYHLNYIYR
jgi:sensor histidine kinase YesM